MTKYTQKQLRQMVNDGIAQDITRARETDRTEILNQEKWLNQVGYACGVYGCNGKLFQGHTTGKLYAVTARTNAIFMF